MDLLAGIAFTSDWKPYVTLSSQYASMRLSLPRIACFFVFLWAVNASAAEPVLEFVEGLRELQYYDTALEYLDEVEKRELPPEVREVIPYERAQTLLASNQGLNNLDEQRKRLDAAQAAFEDFVKSASNHPLAGRANSARGNILMEKARVEIWDGDKPSNEGSRDKFLTQARNYVQEARRIFEQASDQHKKALDAFPTFIPEEEYQKRKDRDAAETQYMEAQLDMAQCNYWEAQAMAEGSEDRKKALEAAAFAFEEIHTKYRSQVAGLYARIWQGKCFEERGDIRIALGLYEEILGHEGTSSTMRNLKDRALRFRLICLNHDERKDYQLVIDEGEAWIKDAKARARTNIGLGIQYEVARALEMLGTERTKPEQERTGYLQRALGFARMINRYPGELKSRTSALIQRVMVALNRDPGEPKDFDTAYGSAGLLYDDLVAQTKLIQEAVAARKMKEAADLDKAIDGLAGETARMYELALKLATPVTDTRLMSIAELKLAYAYLRQKRFLEAAVVGEHMISKGDEALEDLVRDGGFIEVTAYQNAFLELPKGERQFELQMLLHAADRLVKKFPQSDRANDARNAAGLALFNEDDLLGAIEWWKAVPPNTSHFVDAQIKVGKSYWRHYSVQTMLPEEARAKTEDLATWKAESVKFLKSGLDAAEAALPDESPLSDDLVSGKLTLAAIENQDGNYDVAIQLLTAEPHPITAAVAVPEGQARPTDKSSAKSATMASVTYQTLLRAYIGKKDLEKARDARMTLEKVAGSEDAAALTQIFVQFGQELQNELERLRAGNEIDRLNEVRAGFESFLNDLFDRQDGQTFYSLLWIAETFASLGDGSEDNPSKASEYYDKSARSYETIISKGKADPGFLPNPQQITAAKLLLVKTLRRKRDYAAAEKSMLEVLAEQGESVYVQMEAAQLYQDWGSSGGNAYEKLNTALYGSPKDANPKIWGWQDAAQKIGRESRAKPQDESLKTLYFDARYQLAQGERDLGMGHPDNKQSEEHLERARAAITRFLRSSKRWDDEQYARFNVLYRQILSDLKEPVVDLPREPGDVVVGGGGDGQPAKVAGQPAVLEKPEIPQPKSNFLLMGLVVALGFAAVAGLFFVAMKQSSAGRPKYEVADTGPREARPVQLGGVNIAESIEPSLGNVAISAKKAPRPAVKKSPAEAGPPTAPAQRPARPPAAAQPGAQPRPKAPGTPVPGQVKPAAGTPQPKKPAAEGTPVKRPPSANPQQRPAGEAPPVKKPRPKPPTEPPATE